MEGSSSDSSNFSDTSASFKYSRPPKRDLDQVFYDHIRENLPDKVTIQNNTLITKNIQNLFEDLQSQIPDHDMSLSRLAPYGSQLTGLALKNSDIDMTLLTQNDEPNLVAKNLFLTMVKQDDRYFRKFGFLQKFQIRLSHHPAHGLDFLSFSQIRTSETPEIQQSMDLTINGFDVVRESLIIKKMVETSPTLRNLIFLLKRWTRHYKRKNRMNIYAYYIMAIHFLQKVVHPRILPPFDLNQLADFPMNESHIEHITMNPIIEDLSSPKISHLLKEFFKYYGEDYHNGDFGPISIETIGDQGLEEINFDENCLFNILVPFGGHRPGNELNIGTSKAEKHKEEMLKAYQSIEGKTNIFSKEYVRENRQIVKIKNIMEHKGADVFLNKKEKKLMERLRKQDSFSEEPRIKVDSKTEEVVSADIRGNILQESVAEQTAQEKQKFLSHSLEMLGRKGFKVVHYIPKRAFRSSARKEVLLQKSVRIMRFLSK